MEVNDKNFNEEIIESKIPVLIEFWASWCIPCKTIDYLLKELDEEYNGRIKIAKLNIDRNRITPRNYEVTGIPTFLTFKNGEIKEKIVGAQTKQNLIKLIDSVLK
ncbi:hypothetical protein LCGC14_1222850 [marine sediment metagenome]|uniref:Thioredoxin domain-containing protein n=1 Tax=marine sediment metagenome TaxID=412755 RepID=A0A0F9NT30_9ZZZZ|nr:thioredoxin [bacterium]